MEDLASHVDRTDDDRDYDQARGDNRERHLEESAVQRRLRLAVAQAEGRTGSIGELTARSPTPLVPGPTIAPRQGHSAR